MHGQSPAPWSGTTVHARGTVTGGCRDRRARRARRRRLPLILVLVVLTVAGVGAVLGIHEMAHPGQDANVSASDCHLARCRGEAGVSGAAISRAEVAVRARRWLNHTRIRYSSTEGHYGPGGWGWYRRDCSGFVSMALHLPDTDGGANTVDLVDEVVAVSPRNLRPYDLIGHLGPGTGGENGHVQLFLGWVGPHHTRVRVAEQGGLHEQARWPHVAIYRWPERMADGAVLATYRYARISAD